jgi:hypothetical protein
MRRAAAAGWLCKASRGPRSGWEGRVFNSSFACFVIGRAALLLQKFGSGAFYAAPELSIRST